MAPNADAAKWQLNLVGAAGIMTFVFWLKSVSMLPWRCGAGEPRNRNLLWTAASAEAQRNVCTRVQNGKDAEGGSADEVPSTQPQYGALVPPNSRPSPRPSAAGRESRETRNVRLHSCDVVSTVPCEESQRGRKVPRQRRRIETRPFEDGKSLKYKCVWPTAAASWMPPVVHPPSQNPSKPSALNPGESLSM